MHPLASRLKHLAWRMAQASTLFALWLLLVGTTDRREAFAGGVAAVAGTVAMHVVEKQHLAKLLARVDWLAQIARLPKYALTGTWEVFGVLAAQLFRHEAAPSLVQSVPYDACDEGDASATERALAVAYTTMTPNFVVIGIDQDRRRMVYHQVKRGRVLEMTRRLGARA